MNDSVRTMLFTIRSLHFYPALQTRVKHAVIDAVLAFYGPSFEVVSRFVPQLRKEVAGWEDGRRFAIGIMPKGPFITLEKKGAMIRYLGKGLNEPGVTMLFKNYDAALPVFLGIHGAFHAFAQNRVLVDGDLSQSMEINRAVNIVNSYLFPSPMLARVLKRPPRLSLRRMLAKARVYAGLIPAVIRHLL